MRLVLANFKNELQKLCARKKYLVFLIIEIGICLISALVSMLATKFLNANNITLNPTTMPMSVLTFFIEVMIPLIAFMAATDTFSTEYGDRSIKGILVRPISRMKIFISKTLAIAAVAIFNLIAVFAVTTVLELMSKGGMSGFLHSFAAYLLDIIPLFAVILMAVFINQVGKSSTLSMFLCIIIYIILKIIGIFIPQTSGLLFTGYMQWHNLWLGLTLPFGAMSSKIALLLGYGVVFFSGGYYLFAKREF